MCLLKLLLNSKGKSLVWSMKDRALKDVKSLEDQLKADMGWGLEWVERETGCGPSPGKRTCGMYE